MDSATVDFQKRTGGDELMLKTSLQQQQQHFIKNRELQVSYIPTRK